MWTKSGMKQHIRQLPSGDARSSQFSFKRGSPNVEFIQYLKTEKHFYSSLNSIDYAEDLLYTSKETGPVKVS